MKFEVNCVSFRECCELLILCTDFTLSTPIDARKFEYMQRNLHLIDYKGLRNILKLLVVERMQEIPSTITHHHRHMLLPVENVILSADLISLRWLHHHFVGVFITPNFGS